MQKAQCKYCGGDIGVWQDYTFDLRKNRFVPGIRWMHAPEDGPDAYWLCNADLACEGPSPRD